MISRVLMFVGLTAAMGACSKNAQEADALSPAPRDTVRTMQRSEAIREKAAADTTRVRMERPDTSQYGKDSTNRMSGDSTGSR